MQLCSDSHPYRNLLCNKKSNLFQIYPKQFRRCLNFVYPLFCIRKIPESPNWLLSKDRPNDAKKSLQWLRGWVKPVQVQDEFEKLQNHIQLVNACESCAKQRIACQHPTATICDKIIELKRKRNLKPFILVMTLNVLLEFSGAICWRPYIIQVIKAYGIPLNVHTVAMIFGSTSIAGGLCFLLCVKMFGKRRLYLSSTAIVVLCCFGLGDT